MQQFLLPIDYYLLRLLNVESSHPILDQLWTALTHLQRQGWFTWGVLPAVLVFGLSIYRLAFFKLLLVLGLAVGVADLLAYRGIKSFVSRPRPFENPEISSWVRRVGDAHGPSFPSNHAANCFAGAVVLSWYFKRRAHLFYIFAGLIGFSRVALGVHYPSDVFAGAILGIIVGFVITSLMLNSNKRFWLSDSTVKSRNDSGDWRTRTRRLKSR